MKDIIIAIMFILVLIFGFFVMKKIDEFIDTSITHRAPNKEEKYKYYVILDNNDEEELYRMISSIKKEKTNTKVIVYFEKKE